MIFTFLISESFFIIFFFIAEVKAAVTEYWLDQLRTKADTLSSLQYLRTKYLGLSKCHPIFRSCGSSPWEVEKGTNQARLLSGRFRVEALTGHWDPGNREGLCTLPECWRTLDWHKGSVEHFLLSCPSLSSARQTLHMFNLRHLQSNPYLEPIVNECLEMCAVQFWLDCSIMPPVITAVQQFGEGLLFDIFKMTRNYCHGLHRARKALLEND